LYPMNRLIRGPQMTTDAEGVDPLATRAPSQKEIV
jgi:hypothetical protein